MWANEDGGRFPLRGLTQQILPRLLLAPANRINVPIPDVCHLSRKESLASVVYANPFMHRFYIIKSTIQVHKVYEGQLGTV